MTLAGLGELFHRSGRVFPGGRALTWECGTGIGGAMGIGAGNSVPRGDVFPHGSVSGFCIY